MSTAGGSGICRGGAAAEPSRSRRGAAASVFIEGFICFIALGFVSKVRIQDSYSGFVIRVRILGSYPGLVSRIRIQGSYPGFIFRVRIQGSYPVFVFKVRIQASCQDSHQDSY